MAKKSSTPPEPETLTAAKKPAKPKAAKVAKSSPAAKAKPSAAKPASAAPKAAASKPEAPKIVPKGKKKITLADIELRAYFISEDRQKQGLPGDSASDWIEAERQLKAEAAVKPIL